MSFPITHLKPNIQIYKNQSTALYCNSIEWFPCDGNMIYDELEMT